MTNDSQTRFAAEPASALGRRAGVSEAAQVLLRDGLAPVDVLRLLVDRQLFVDAIKYLAHSLPKREAVWWSAQCARLVLGEPPPALAAALQVAEAWCREPSEPNRRAAMVAAEKAEFGNPAGCAALAAFFSGGSLAPENLPAVPPPDHLTAQSAASAAMLAAVMKEPEKAPEKYRRFLDLGVEVGNGVKRWKP